MFGKTLKELEDNTVLGWVDHSFNNIGVQDINLLKDAVRTLLSFVPHLISTVVLILQAMGWSHIT